MHIIEKMAEKMQPKRLCGSRHLATGEPKAKTELSTAAYSRSEAGAELFGCFFQPSKG